MTITSRFLSIGAVVLALACGAAADTLELKNGQVLQGKYLGGTQVVVRFEVQGDVRTFHVREIERVSFSRRDRDGDTDGQDSSRGGPPPDSTQGTYDSSQGQYDSRDQSGAQGQYDPSQNSPDSDMQRRDGDRDRRDGDRDRRNADRDRQDGDRDRQDPNRQYSMPNGPITVPAGKTLLVRMIDDVDSKRNDVGDVFHASLENDVIVDDFLAVRRGTDVYGRLAYVKESGTFAGSAELQLELAWMVVDGKEYTLSSSDYTMKGRGRGGDTAKRAGVGAVAGAIIGGIAGGGEGAAIGAGVGGAAGAGSQVFTRGHEVRVPSETLLEFRLQQPVTIDPNAQNYSNSTQN